MMTDINYQRMSDAVAWGILKAIVGIIAICIVPFLLLLVIGSI